MSSRPAATTRPLSSHNPPPAPNSHPFSIPNVEPDPTADHIDQNPHMLKTASYTAYRTGSRPHLPPKKPSWINTARSINLSPHSRSPSRTASPVGTPVGTPRSRSPATASPPLEPQSADQGWGFGSQSASQGASSGRSQSIRSFTAGAAAMGKQPGKSEEPPTREMVRLPGLLSEVRRFGDFRRVLHTGLYSQLVAMEIPVGGDIGEEVHAVDQILLFTHGTGLAQVAGREQPIAAGDVVVVPAGAQHQFLNTGSDALELVTVYSPAEHHPRTVHKTKEEGDAEEENGLDEPPAWARRSSKENEEAGLVEAE